MELAALFADPKFVPINAGSTRRALNGNLLDYRKYRFEMPGLNDSLITVRKELVQHGAKNDLFIELGIQLATKQKLTCAFMLHDYEDRRAWQETDYVLVAKKNNPIVFRNKSTGGSEPKPPPFIQLSIMFMNNKNIESANYFMSAEVLFAKVDPVEIDVGTYASYSLCRAYSFLKDDAGQVVNAWGNWGGLIQELESKGYKYPFDLPPLELPFQRYIEVYQTLQSIADQVFGSEVVIGSVQTGRRARARNQARGFSKTGEKVLFKGKERIVWSRGDKNRYVRMMAADKGKFRYVMVRGSATERTVPRKKRSTVKH